MIKFLKSERRYLDTASGASMQISAGHPNDDSYEIYYQGIEESRRFSLEVRKNNDGDIEITVHRSAAFFPERSAWLNYNGSPEHLADLKPFLKAWSDQYFSAPPIHV